VRAHAETLAVRGADADAARENWETTEARPAKRDAAIRATEEIIVL
jgi:hypothetical protein